MQPALISISLRIYDFLCSSFLLTSQMLSVQFSYSVWLFVTPWTAAHQTSLSIANSRSLLKLMSIESMMPPNHLILCFIWEHFLNIQRISFSIAIRESAVLCVWKMSWFNLHFWSILLLGIEFQMSGFLSQLLGWVPSFLESSLIDLRW